MLSSHRVFFFTFFGEPLIEKYLMFTENNKQEPFNCLKKKEKNRSIQTMISAKHTAFITLHVYLRWPGVTSSKTSYVQKER